tara:strand:+ start:1829 stop:2542 length:714 start_codon:yes stop_codon:yes gene_type:complete
METTELGNSNPAVSGDSSNGERYSVKVDGVEQLVTLDELQNGYQRQADYTRKTQELARERERLTQAETIVQALETDPQSAISALGDAFGVGVGMGNQTHQMPEDDLDDLDPDEVRLRRIESAIEEQNRAHRQDNLRKEMDVIRDKYETDISEQELYAHALKHNIGNLDAAYAHLNYENMLMNTQAEQQEAQILEEKRNAVVVDSTPGSAPTSLERAAGAVNSIHDAFELARSELAQQ